MMLQFCSSGHDVMQLTIFNTNNKSRLVVVSIVKAIVSQLIISFDDYCFVESCRNPEITNDVLANKLLFSMNYIA